METLDAPQWSEVEIAFSGPEAANPYIDVDAWVIFGHDSGRELRRPIFWDGRNHLPRPVCLHPVGGEVAVECPHQSP
jgi:Domain of unknown function (DUF5060)